MKKLIFILMMMVFISCASQSGQQGKSDVKTGGIAAQKVVVVTPKYVVIEVDPSISRNQAIVEVRRMEQRNSVAVGKIQLVKFHENKVAARILEQKDTRRIQVGDFVVLSRKSFNEMNVRDYINAVKTHSSNEIAMPKT